ncbi:unnamed protein product [Plutella xylostella]|uniref:(diamondback moth) hypothetical protein n=1 Tax=Plutella xylostella TaxID=51655 RepID=A0A8S4EVW9_PLUXY|nr:unnamed protein product [Plutella xylostella]
MVTMNSSEKAQKACQQGPSRDNSSKGAKDERDSRKEPAPAPAAPPSVQALLAAVPPPEEAPNYLVYKKMEAIIDKMQDENTGVPVRTVKSFMSKIPSVFTGSDLISWLMRHLNLEETWEALHLAHQLASHGYLFPIDDHNLSVKNDNTYYSLEMWEALHLAHQLASHGYLFPIDDHNLSVKNDNTYYRFQTPYFWPSNQWEPENTDYAVYLCKRTMQNKARLELADYEAESLARLQKMFTRKWEFIFMQAEAQSKVDKKRDKLERKVLDSQERAFWDVHRPMPGCVNTTELDPKKLSRINAMKEKRLKQCQELAQQHNLKNNPIVTITNPQESEEEIQKKQNAENSIKENGESSKQPTITVTALDPAQKPEPTIEQQIEAARRQLSMLRQRLERRNIKVSKVADIYLSGGCSSTEQRTVTAAALDPAQREPTIEQQIEAARRRLSMLRRRLERRNITVSKVADILGTPELPLWRLQQHRARTVTAAALDPAQREPTIEQQIEAARRRLSMLRRRLQRRNITVSKVADISTEQRTVTAAALDPAQREPTIEQQIEAARRRLSMLRRRLQRRNMKVSKVADMFIAYYEQYAEYDAFLTAPEWPNPWIHDTTELWEQERQCKDPLPLRRVRRWGFGLRELIHDPAGREHFARFLSKEFSGENLKFWIAVQELKQLPIRRVAAAAKEIWKEFLANDAASPVNIDAVSRELTRQKVESGTPDRYCFDQAQAHVYHLMKSDSYSRYLRSEMYKDYLNGSKKKTSVKGIRSIVSFTGRKETSTNN